VSTDQTALRRFRILEAVGKGGFGTVYRAELQGAGGFRKQVALKVLNPEVAESVDLAERLRDEARMLGLLRHRAIVQVDGLHMLDGKWTVVMEFIDGVDLSRVIANGAMPVGPALEIAEEVSDALHSAYDAPSGEGEPLRVLHRDIKPSNIQLTPSGEVKVLDFGVARAEFQRRESVTRSILFGSLDYMAPERVDGIDTHAGDVYALGALLYELLAGEALGRTATNRERHEAAMEERLSGLFEAIGDERLVSIIAQCTAYDDGDRPTAGELARMLRRERLRFPSPWLKDWASDVVPELMRSRDHTPGELTGCFVSTSLSALPRTDTDEDAPTDPAIEPEPRGEYWIAVAAAIVVLLVGLSAASVLGVAAVWFGGEPSTLPPPAEAAPTDDAAINMLATDLEVPELTPEVQQAPRRVVRDRDDDRDEYPDEFEDIDEPEPAEDSSGEPSLHGTVLARGDPVDLRLVGSAGTLEPGRVPAGTYSLQGRFDGAVYTPAGSVTVHAGEVVTVVCRSGLRRCTSR